MSKIIELEKRYLRALEDRLVLNHTMSDYEAYSRQLERLNAILEIEKKVNNKILKERILNIYYERIKG